MTASLLPNAKQQFINGNGVPLAGGSVYFYVPNTNTLKNTWQNATQTILNANPVILDSSGEAIIYGSGQYRQVVYDAQGNLIWDQLTQDLLALIQAGAGVVFGGTSTGTANAQIIAPSPALTSIATGQQISFFAGFSNTTAMTLTVNALTYAVKVAGVNTILHNVVAGMATLVEFDGTNLQLINPQPTYALPTPGTIGNTLQSNGTAWVSEPNVSSLPVIDVRTYGAVSDARNVIDAVVTSGVSTITSATANFTNADVGKTIKIYDIANNAYPFLGTIIGVVSSTVATLSGNALATTVAGNAIAYWGTDNATAINAALSAASGTISQRYGEVNAPSGDGYAEVIFPVTPGVGAGYLFGSSLTTYRNVKINANAMLYNAIGGSASDRAWAINCAAGIQIDQLIMECGGGMGIQNGTVLTQSSSYIWQCQLWNVGTNFNSGLSPTSQTCLHIQGYDYQIQGFWCKGGSVGIFIDQAGDIRMSLPEVIGCSSGLAVAASENIQITNITFDTNNFIGATVDGTHTFFCSGNLFSVNNAGLTYGFAIGLNDTTHINRNIKLDFSGQRQGGIFGHIAYTQDSTFQLLGSNSANYSSGGIDITTMVEYGTGNVGIVNVNSTRDNTSSPPIANFSGTRYGIFYDNYMNGSTPTLHLYGTFTNP